MKLTYDLYQCLHSTAALQVKDKLHIGSKDDKIGSATYNKHTTDKAEAPGTSQLS